MSREEQVSEIAARWCAKIGVDFEKVEFAFGDGIEGNPDASGFTATREDGRVLIAIADKAFDPEPGIEHIVLHELVHAATAINLEQMGAPTDEQYDEWAVAQIEYLTDQISSLLLDQPSKVLDQGEIRSLAEKIYCDRDDAAYHRLLAILEASS